MSSSFDTLAARAEALVFQVVPDALEDEVGGRRSASVVQLGAAMSQSWRTRSAVARATERRILGGAHMPTAEPQRGAFGDRQLTALQILGGAAPSPTGGFEDDRPPKGKAGARVSSGLGGSTRGTDGGFGGSGPGARGADGHSSIIQKAALAAGAQPAVVKIVSRAAGTARTRALLTYLGTREDPSDASGRKRIDIAITNERGEVATTAAAREAILAEWSQDFETGHRSQDVGRFELKARGGSARLEVIKDALSAGFGDRRLAFALHRSKGDQNTVEAVVVLTGRGAWLKPSRSEVARIEGRMAAVLEAGGAEAVSLELKGTGHGIEGVGYQLARLSGKGSRPVHTERLELVEGEGVRTLVKSWGAVIRPRAPRDVFHVVFSARAGTDHDGFERAVQAVLDREFAGHAYALAPHADKRHVHVHVVIKARGLDGRKLDPRIPDLARYREALATAAREQGIAMVATRRPELGATRPYTLAHAQLTERGVAGERTRQRVAEKRAQAQLPEPHPKRRAAAARAASEWQAATALLQSLSPTSAVKAAQGVAAAIVTRFAAQGFAPAVTTRAPSIDTGTISPAVAGGDSATENTGQSSSPIHTLLETLMAAKSSRDVAKTLDTMKTVIGEMRTAVPEESLNRFETAGAKLIAVGEARLQQAVQRENRAEIAAKQAVSGGEPTGAPVVAPREADPARTDRRMEDLRSAENGVERETAAVTAAAQRAQSQAAEREARATRPDRPRTAADIADASRARRDLDAAQRLETNARRERAQAERDVDEIRAARERTRDRDRDLDR